MLHQSLPDDDDGFNACGMEELLEEAAGLDPSAFPEPVAPAGGEGAEAVPCSLVLAFGSTFSIDFDSAAFNAAAEAVFV